MKTIILIGNMYSGKTTFAKALEKEIEFKRFSIDDYRIKYGDNTVPGENLAWDMLYKEALKAKNCILDTTGLSKQIDSRIWGSIFKIGIICKIVELHERRVKEDHRVPYPYNFTDVEESMYRMQKLVQARNVDIKFHSDHQSPQEMIRLLKESESFNEYLI
ncbi:MAG: hypothetical protein H8E51_07095 [Bacteroidetes bacterium]|nr:hypothetical protein [Bacteroidota bacterium]